LKADINYVTILGQKLWHSTINKIRSKSNRKKIIRMEAYWRRKDCRGCLWWHHQEPICCSFWSGGNKLSWCSEYSKSYNWLCKNWCNRSKSRKEYGLHESHWY